MAEQVPKKKLTGDRNIHDVSAYEKGITGSCLCKNITVTIHSNIFPPPSSSSSPSFKSSWQTPPPLSTSSIITNMTYSHFEEKMNTNTKAKPIPHVHFCHCSNCRKSSGSYVSANLRIESKTITIADPQGSLKKYEDGDTASGNVVVREFCGGCGCPISTESPRLPDITVLRMGLFPRIPKPTAELFALHRNEWEADLEDVVLCKAGWDSGILEESQESQESRNLEDWVSESDSEGRD